MLQSIGMCVVALGIIGVIWGVFQKIKAGRVADAPFVATGDAANRGPQVASPKGAISAQGRLHCAQPLVSPVSGTPCLYYRVKCTAIWKEGNNTKQKELDDQKQAVSFTIDDGSGPVTIDARKGGSFDGEKVKEETKGGGLLGGLTGGDVMFGAYRVTTGALSLGTKYRVREEVLPVSASLYACGKASDGGITSPEWRALILSSKTREELLSSATKQAKLSLVGGAAMFVVGGALSVIGAMMAPSGAPAQSAGATEQTRAGPPAAIAAAPVSGRPDQSPPDTATATSPSSAAPAITGGAKPGVKPNAKPAPKPAPSHSAGAKN